MRRFLTSLKYLPAALCGLLAVLWVVGLFVSYGLSVPVADHTADMSVENSSIRFDYPLMGAPRGVYGSVEPFWHSPFPYRVLIAGDFVWQVYDDLSVTSMVCCPIPFLLTCLLPFAIATCLNRFRFPLWSWFVWTAVLAVELAYYATRP